MDFLTVTQHELSDLGDTEYKMRPENPSILRVSKSAADFCKVHTSSASRQRFHHTMGETFVSTVVSSAQQSSLWSTPREGLLHILLHRLCVTYRLSQNLAKSESLLCSLLPEDSPLAVRMSAVFDGKDGSGESLP